MAVGCRRLSAHGLPAQRSSTIELSPFCVVAMASSATATKMDDVDDCLLANMLAKYAELLLIAGFERIWIGIGISEFCRFVLIVQG